MTKIKSCFLLANALMFGACSDNSDAPGDAANTCPAAWTAVPSTDPTINVPADGGSVLLHTAATGTQSYKCTKAADGTYSWVFTHPTARLADCNNVQIGEHSAPNAPTAPQWNNVDGSMVEGRKVNGIAVTPTAIPWLLLSAFTHTGDGIMSHVKYVQRANTIGGIAPSTTCDATNADATSDVPYTADYYFYGS